MILSEIVTIGKKQYTRTWSDKAVMIERDGILYEEAIDPVDSGRSYVESPHPVILPNTEISNPYNDLYDLRA